MHFENNNYNLASSKKGINTSICGASESFNVLNDNSEIKIDIIAQSHFNSSIWGQIKDEEGNFISSALVRLVKTVYKNNTIEYITIAKCISDHNGFYQFNIDSSSDDSSYKIMISKTNIETL
ncbi:MAG: hypothetical protein ACRCTZ_03415 [Sarcina sp.]